MAGNITASCSGSNLASAVSDYSSTCLAQGVTVCMWSCVDVDLIIATNNLTSHYNLCSFKLSNRISSCYCYGHFDDRLWFWKWIWKWIWKVSYLDFCSVIEHECLFSFSSTSTGTAATTSATGKSGATSISAPSAGLWISIILACSFVSQHVL